MSRDFWNNFAPSRPIRADGIKAKSQHGSFGAKWWSGRWIQALERLGQSARLQRGRTYARQGQVLDIKVEEGEALARVQGSRKTPYTVSIKLKHLTNDQWTKVVDGLVSEARFAASLLAGEMPQDIEQVFQGAQADLFPTKSQELETDCSCPDWANPCKHIAAVHYLLAEQLDEDPFLLFALRGRSRDQIVGELRARRTGSEVAEDEGAEQVLWQPTPLDADLEHFWGTGTLPNQHLDFGQPAVPLAPLRRLGPPPFWPARLPEFFETFTPIYAAIRQHALEAAFHTTPDVVAKPSNPALDATPERRS